MHIEGYEINNLDEELMFSNYTAKSKHEKDDKNEGTEESNISTQLVFGITLTLCGLFLTIIPFPVCKAWGERMIASGFVICGNSISGKMDNNQKKAKDKK